MPANDSLPLHVQFLGSSGSGKSSAMMALDVTEQNRDLLRTLGEANKPYFSTVKVDSHRVPLDVNNKTVSVILHDTSRGEGAQQSLYRPKDVYVLCCSADPKEWNDNMVDIIQWKNKIERYRPDAKVIVMLTKTDVPNAHTLQDAQKQLEDLDLPIVAFSAKKSATDPNEKAGLMNAIAEAAKNRYGSLINPTPSINVSNNKPTAVKAAGEGKRPLPIALLRGVKKEAQKALGHFLEDVSRLTHEMGDAVKGKKKPK